MTGIEPQATGILITNILQLGLGACALAIVVFSISPRLKRISSRLRRVERRMGIPTPTPGAIDDTGPIRRVDTEH